MPIIRLRCLTIAATALAIVTPTLTADDADLSTKRWAPSSIQQAERSLQAGNATAALETLKTLNTADLPRSLREHVEALTCEVQLGLNEAEAAIKACSAALTIDNQDWTALNNRAVAYMRLGRHEEALSDLKAATRLNPSSKVPFRNKARVRQLLAAN